MPPVGRLSSSATPGPFNTAPGKSEMGSGGFRVKVA